MIDVIFSIDDLHKLLLQGATMGRVSKEQANKNRLRVLAAASELFRRRGIAGVNIADIMAEAGLTHGAFYKQFASKEALAAEAMQLAFESAREQWASTRCYTGQERLEALSRLYLRDDNEDACPLPTLGGEVARSEAQGELRGVYSNGARAFAELLNESASDDRGLALLAALVGARLLRKALNDATLANRIDEAVVKIAKAHPRP